MRRRMFLALGSIASILLLSSIISMVEYIRMNSFVSEKIARNINCLNQSQRLADMASEFNLEMLSVVMSNDLSKRGKFSPGSFKLQCDTLRHSMTSPKASSATDKVMVSFEDFMTASLKLEEVFLSDSVSAETWFFEELQPKYVQLRREINSLNTVIHDELLADSEGFDQSFYRGIMPGMVAVGAGLLLVFLLMYFINVLYVRPLYKISEGIDNYRSSGKNFSYDFEGDDQIANINTGVTELTEENAELKRRISILRHNNLQSRNSGNNEGDSEQ